MPQFMQMQPYQCWIPLLLLFLIACGKDKIDETQPLPGENQTETPSDTARMILLTTRTFNDSNPPNVALTAYSPNGNKLWEKNDLGTGGTPTPYYYKNTVFIAVSRMGTDSAGQMKKMGLEH